MTSSDSFKALGSPHRLELFKRIRQCGNRELCVSELAQGLGITKATVSHHIKALTDAGLIKVIKKGRHVYCEVRQDTLKKMNSLLK